MKLSDELEAVKTSNDNLERLSEIFFECFGIRVGKDYFNWKYLGNPAGEVVAFEAVNSSNREIAAFYGIIPEKYMVHGKEMVVYQSMDTMTHPRYQKRGLFIKLANITYDYAAERDGKLYLLGIPGMSSFPGFVNKLAWINSCNFSYLFSHRAMLTGYGLLRPSGGISLQPIDSFDASADEFFANKENSKPIYKVYNKEVLNWKVTNHPFQKFRSFKILQQGAMIGLLIVLPEGDKVKVFYCDFLKNEQRKYLNAVMRKLARYVPFKYVYTWENTDAEMNRAYRKAGFLVNRRAKGPFTYKVPFIVHARDAAGTEQWLKADNFELHPLIQD